MRPSLKYKIIYRKRGSYSISEMCKFFEVSRSGYYSFVNRIGQPDRDKPMAELIQERRVGRFGKSLGCRRMQKWLEQEKDLHYNYKTVWRVMQKYGLLSECRRKRYHRPGEVMHVYPNDLNRNFHSEQPDTKWVTDITYIQTPQGTLYLSAILDLYDRHVVAYRLSTRNDCKLVTDTLTAAMKTKKVTVKRQLHSDQGIQYTSQAYFSLTKEYGISPSMSRRSNPYDNAVVENFFGMFKTECIYPCRPQTIAQARQLVQFYIDFYNGERMKLK